VCAGNNPPSVLTIFRFAAYRAGTYSSIWPCSIWVSFFIPFLEISGFAIIVRQIGFFSVLLPVISDYPSLDHISCNEGGVSSAIAVIVHQLTHE